MSALILKSTNALDSSVESLDFTVYKSRVLADGGYIVNEQATKDAITFARNNNITDGMAFSITSASWGVKASNGKPSKLYSLFNSAGDIDIAVSKATTIDFNTSTGYNSIKLTEKTATANTLVSSGAANNVENAGMLVIAKPLALSVGTDYGSTNNFALANFAEMGTATSAADRALKQILVSLYIRADSSKMPIDWDYRNLAYNSTGALTDATSPTQNWSSETLFVDTSGLYVYNAGNQVQVDSTVTQPTYKNNIKLTLGRSVATTLQNLDYTNPLIADIAEAWCLVNTTSIIMQAVSLRASQKYV